MRGLILIFFISSLPVLGYPSLLQAQAVAKGKIVDAKTKKPLSGAHVFLAGTKIGTATNSNGHYHLRRIPPGGHRLVVSMIGYKKTLINMVIGPGETHQMDFKLKPIIYEMPEIFVGNLDKKWKKHFNRFTELFIGVSETADSVKILNPEVLRFETRWWGRLTAEALAPLKIENRALGYRITYYLDEFKHTGTRTQWDGEPLFIEMTPADSSQAEYWKQNRKDAFYGSLRHFFLALLENRVKEEGFIIHTLREDVYGLSPHRFPVKAKRIIQETDESYLQHISFFGQLEIIYTRDKEDRRYVRWVRELQRGPAGVQTSYLELNERPITVDTDGEVLEPYGATQFGYFAFQRLADATPREYRPAGYPLLQ